MGAQRSAFCYTFRLWLPPPGIIITAQFTCGGRCPDSTLSK